MERVAQCFAGRWANRFIESGRVVVRTRLERFRALFTTWTLSLIDRGTRSGHVLSRKNRLISSSIVCPAYVANFTPCDGSNRMMLLSSPIRATWCRSSSSAERTAFLLARISVARCHHDRPLGLSFPLFGVPIGRLAQIVQIVRSFGSDCAVLALPG